MWMTIPAAEPVRAEEPSSLQQAKTHRQLFKMIRKSQPRHFYGGGPVWVRQIMVAANVSTDSGGGAGAPSFTPTNVQVEGVDEADVVKTDGRFIYQINERRVLVIRCHPTAALAVVGQIEFQDENFYPINLYLDGDHLVVIGSNWRPMEGDTDSARLAFVRFGTSITQAIVYDVSDPAQPKPVREVEVEGDHVSSRKVDAHVYLITRQYPDFYMLRVAGERGTMRSVVPAMRDTATGNRFRRLRAAEIFYIDGFSEPNYLVVAGFSLDRPDERADVKAILGAGDEVYASRQNLYVAGSEFGWGGPIFILPVLATEPASDVADDEDEKEPQESTRIFRFALNDGTVAPTGEGRVPGSILNQFSMDEHEGHFRVATTTHGVWQQSEDSNNVYVLDETLKIVGALEGLAEGERIYAARFIGGRCYLVTFRNIDPLHVIDLSDPADPVVLGELHIPGYSNYLHPLDANHLIGIGKDAVVYEDESGSDPWMAGRVFYQGMKLAVFDVSDVSNPVEKSSVTIGARGTDSEVLWNHKALMFDAARGLMAFPLTVAQHDDPDAPRSPWEYGRYVFQGAYVYQVSPDSGFVFKGGITHLEQSDEFWASYNEHIHRVLSVGGDLLTLSGAEAQAHDAVSLEFKAGITLPVSP
jgi:uncharacterized secreted protein with C-terminal beta-propeller domain